MVHMPTVNSAATPDRGSGMEHLQAYRAAGGGKHRANRRIVTSGLGQRLLIAAAVMFAAGIANSESKAQSGPFAPLAGSWSGSGTVTLDDGSTERSRRRGKYAPARPTTEVARRRADPLPGQIRSGRTDDGVVADLRQRRLQVQPRRQRKG